MAVKFSFRGQLHGIKFDEKSFTKKFDAAAKILVRQAARAWLRTVIVKVPAWTGFAQGSIKFAKGPNGDLAAFLRVAFPITPNPAARNKNGTPYPKHYFTDKGTKILKTPENGGRFGHYNFPSAQMRYRFRYSNEVIHFEINEFYTDVSPKSPWNSMAAASKAFQRYIKANAKNLPHVNSFLVNGPVIRFGEYADGGE